MKLQILSFFLIVNCVLFSQIQPFNDSGSSGFRGLNYTQLDSISNDEIKVSINGNTKYTDYKIINQQSDTAYIDTTLTIKKHYKFNFRRKDNFGLLPFHNQGQTFNNLVYNYNEQSAYPDIGFTSKQFNYIDIKDVEYYQVPTPTTEIMYKTGQEQGQVLDALFTLNFNKRLNLSLAYRGLRSLGQYRRSLSSTGNFRTTLSYVSPQKTYGIRVHVANQDFINQESGGLPQEMLLNFTGDNPEFSDRARLDVNLIDAENKFEGTRFYLEHSYKLFSSMDSTNTKDFSNLKLGHKLRYEQKEYQFIQKTQSEDFFGPANVIGEVNENVNNGLWDNQAYIEFNSKYVLGRFKVKANYTTVSYGYNEVLNSLDLVGRYKLRGNAVSFGADWKGKIGGLQIKADARVIPGNGHLAGNYIKGEALYQNDSLFTVKGTVTVNSKAPNFNFQLFQSSYNNYNWDNNFDNVDTQNLGFSFFSNWVNASMDFTNLKDYVYFDENAKPQQYDNSVTYLKVKVGKEFRFGRFAVDNTVLYQNVTSGSEVFRIPDFVTRNTIYYTDNWFKGDPLLVNIGVSFNYFTKYKMNAYNPLLAEFTLQDDTEIGYPTFDAFFNARVRRTRIYFKVDNLSSMWLKKNYFSAPNYPYRDLSIRFGLVWNWFI